MIQPTQQNFDEVLNKIKQCNNQENLPIIQINLIRPKMTFRLFSLLMVGLPAFIIFIKSVIEKKFYFELLAFFTVWFFIFWAFLIFEIKNYKIKAFWNKIKDTFYCQLTPEYFIYRLNGDELKLDWHNIMDFSYIWGGKMNQNHIMITQRNGNLLRIFKSQTTLNIKELDRPLTAYFRKCRTFNPNNKSVSLLGFKL